MIISKGGRKAGREGRRKDRKSETKRRVRIEKQVKYCKRKKIKQWRCRGS